MEQWSWFWGLAEAQNFSGEGSIAVEAGVVGDAFDEGDGAAVAADVFVGVLDDEFDVGELGGEGLEEGDGTGPRGFEFEDIGFDDALSVGVPLGAPVVEGPVVPVGEAVLFEVLAAAFDAVGIEVEAFDFGDGLALGFIDLGAGGLVIAHGGGHFEDFVEVEGVGVVFDGVSDLLDLFRGAADVEDVRDVVWHGSSTLKSGGTGIQTRFGASKVE